MLFLAVCAAITMSGGAAVVAGERRFGSATTADVPSLQVYWPAGDTVSELLRRTETGAAGLEIFTADAGGSVIKTRALSPTMKGDVSSFLEQPDVRDAVDDILSAVEDVLPGYQTLLEVVKNPDDNDDDGSFLMVSVVMEGDDTAAWERVETVIDEHWLQLPPHVRAAVGVGREFLPLG